MKEPTLKELQSLYEKMSQKKFDGLDPKTLTDVGRTAYTEEFARRNNTVEKSSNESVSYNLSKLSPKEIIQFLRNNLGEEYEIWQNKQRILILKNLAVGCVIHFDFDESGNFTYKSPSAHYSKWFAFIVAILLTILLVGINIYLYEIKGISLGGITIMIQVFTLRIIVGVLTKIPSKGFVEHLEQVMATEYEPWILKHKT